MNGFQKFLCVVDWRGKTDFFIITIILARAFFYLFSDLMDQKMAGGKRIVIVGSQFFHARQPSKGVFIIHSHRCNFFPELLMAASIPGVGIFS